MTYQVNLSANGPDGFTEEQLLTSLRQHALSVTPPLEVRRSDQECLELHGRDGLLVTLCPAGPEPYDYLLVDFEERRGRDESHELSVVAQVAAKLDLSVLEIESRLEYEPLAWAAARGQHHGPDPARQLESRRLELDRELEFYQRLCIPYSPDDVIVLQEAAAEPADPAIQDAARNVRRQKKHEEKVARAARRTAAAQSPDQRGRPAPAWWPFGRSRR